MISSQWASSEPVRWQVDCRQRVHSIKQSVTVCIIAEVKCCFEHIPHKLHDPREHVREHGAVYPWPSRSSVANVPRLLPAVRVLAARRFVAWNALRLADDGDALIQSSTSSLFPFFRRAPCATAVGIFLSRLKKWAQKARKPFCFPS